VRGDGMNRFLREWLPAAMFIVTLFGLVAGWFGA
jgi:hypothetical protein